METIILVLTLLFGSPDNCTYGDMTLFEDFSYRLVEHDAIYTCDYGSKDSYFEFSEIEFEGNSAIVTTTQITYGLPFPESARVESFRYDIRWLQYPK
jgi:hypothetical protein